MDKSDATSETAVAEILLQGTDLLSKNDDYLTLMDQHAYLAKYEHSPKVVYNGRRLLIVLPLHVVVNINPLVIPIPFIIDTGAPEFIYLGSGARKRLREMNLLVDLVDKMNPNHQQNYYQLLGVFNNREKSLHRPYAEDVPALYERSLKGDIRINILGLKGMDALGVNIEWTKIFRI